MKIIFYPKGSDSLNIWLIEAHEALRAFQVVFEELQSIWKVLI